MSEYDPFRAPPPDRPAIRLGTDTLGSEDHDIFFAAVETTRMPMLITDPRRPDNPIVFANQAFLHMTGYTPAELIGRNCRFLQGPETDPATVDAVREAVLSQREIATEILNYRKDGSSFWNALFISPVRNRAGELTYFFASQLDVSRRRDAEVALRQAQKMEALGQLTGGIAHDFNNLLQVIFGHLDVIRLVGAGDASVQAKSLASIRNAAEKGKALTQQLLAFARKQQLQGRVINLNGLVAQLGELAARTLGRNAELKTELAADLWNCRIDPTQAEVAMLNLLINARDAMPHGGTVRIETANCEVGEGELNGSGLPLPGRYVCVSVIDDGEGIAPELLGRVMEPFFTTKEDGAGTGLGLAMVYGFAKQSGGAATLYSEVGVGTTVRLCFPATDAESAHAEPRAAAAHLTGSERVLVVDDRPEVAEMTELMLSSLGYRTTCFTRAADALAHLEQNRQFDLLVSDLIMPGGMNGVILARRARQLLPKLKVLLTTGFADASLERNGGGDSEFEMIFKPYGQGELARRVRQVLQGPTGVS
ncbi:MAG TPA: histidine kinase famiy protein [Methylibium sp.]|uniref:histidine kinase famiy protein n=1 Tax=Methylibium sp. TaxID=2067992 RepID=UPI002DB92383|nr:histidine kinase famiy protein [Methylibium sp.]HEU4457518.1 histidine kinase famiy protein [Methylibium sp.]